MITRMLLLLLAVCAYTASSSANTVGSFLVANNDVPPTHPPTGGGNTLTFYSLGPGGSIHDKTVVATGGNGVGGGSFAASRVVIVPQDGEVCVFASDAATADVVGVKASTHTVTGNYLAAATDSGIANGIGLAANADYLYAAFSSSSTIATFAIQSGCVLEFLGDVFTIGVQGGLVGGMAVHGSMMVVTYGDGSVASFDISAGLPMSNGDALNSTGYADDHLPNGVLITADGHFAIFGDASTVTTLEVSDIASGRLTATVVYDVGSAWNSATVALSPDESLIFATNNSGGRITAAYFDKKTATISPGCSSGPLGGFYSAFAYAGAVALQRSAGAGGLLYVPEFGSNGVSSIGVVQFKSTGTTCTLTELAHSPIADDESPALLSIGVYANPQPLPNE